MYLGISVSTLPVSRLLINPAIEATDDFEEWYTQHIKFISLCFCCASYWHLTSHMCRLLHALGTLALKVLGSILI